MTGKPNIQCLSINLLLMRHLFKIIYDQKAATAEEGRKMTSTGRNVRFCVARLIVKRKMIDDVLAINLSYTALLSLPYDFCVDSISYLTNAEPGVRSCGNLGTYFQNPYLHFDAERSNTFLPVARENTRR